MKFARILLPVCTLCAAAVATPPTDILHGHFEVHVDYTVTPGNPDAGWKFSTSYNLNDDFNDRTQVVRMDPAATAFIAGPVTRQTITPALGRLGTVGDPIWILPQDLVPGTPYLGVRTTMNSGIFQSRSMGNYEPSPQGSISLRLVSVTGTGPEAGGRFATWRTDSFGSLLFSFDTSDGISSADEIPTIPASSHTHHSWGMTHPGTYHVTFEAFGKLNPWQPDGGTLTSARQTFTFQVPFSGEAGEGHEIRISPKPLIAIPAESAAYKADRAWIGARVPDGSGWRTSGTLATAPLPVSNGIGVSPEAAASLAPGWSDLKIQILDVRGPGLFSWLDENGSPLDLEEGFPIGNAERRNFTATFSETGIYRVRVAVSGRYQNQPAYTSAVLTYGAGLGPDFTYSAWAASFGKTAGLPAETLADPAADHDGDGLTNGSEYALFWHGFDPTVADAGKMPLPHPTPEGYAAFDFLRDGWKDRMNGSGWRILPQASRDLVQWTTLSPLTNSYPLEIFETGAEEGNARGPVMKRRVRLMPGPESRAFFRFRITDP